jgi:hypothetical protein
LAASGGVLRVARGAGVLAATAARLGSVVCDGFARRRDRDVRCKCRPSSGAGSGLFDVVAAITTVIRLVIGEKLIGDAIGTLAS